MVTIFFTCLNVKVHRILPTRCIYMLPIWFLYTTFISQNSIKRLVLVMGNHWVCLFCKVGTDIWHKFLSNFRPQSVHGLRFKKSKIWRKISVMKSFLVLLLSLLTLRDLTFYSVGYVQLSFSYQDITSFNKPPIRLREGVTRNHVGFPGVKPHMSKVHKPKAQKI
jgi:hypothetical protein